MLLGQISLNLSFILYMFLYLPQVIHNQKQSSLSGLSLWMHGLLYGAYSLDLIYGCGQNLPWQYCAVSATGWLLLNMQHLQFIAHFRQQKKTYLGLFFYGILIFTSLILIWGVSQKPFNSWLLNCFGYLAQLGFVCAFIPQIGHSIKLRSAQAMNVIYLLLNFFLAGLDNISAWQLGWGWPNKLGASSIMFLTTILLLQQRKYRQ